MASLVNDPNGRKRICFQSHDGKRKSLRLGIMPANVAQDYCDKVEHLLTCFNAPHMIGEEVLEWSAELPDTLYRRFVRAGLLLSREAAKI